MPAWRLITSWDADPGFNMGLDEALLTTGGPRPTLRLYTWKPDCLSLGYFQRWTDVPAVAEASTVVRRITGGGAIHHTEELTFSISAPLDHELYAGPVTDSYRRVHGAISDALAQLGIESSLRAKTELASDQRGTGMCFHQSTDLDIAWSGRKGVGSAQRRKDGRVLHHGSIKLAPSSLESGVATVAEEGARTDPEGMGRLLVEALGRRFALEFEEDLPTDEELEEAYRRAPVYSSEEFLRRR